MRVSLDRLAVSSDPCILPSGDGSGLSMMPERRVEKAWPGWTLPGPA